MALGLAQAAMVGDLRELKKKLKEQGSLLSRGFKKVESEKKERDERRKEIVLEVLRAALKGAHEVDSNLVKEIKSEVYDKKEAAENLEEKIVSLIKSVKSSEEEDEEMMKAGVKELTDQVDDLNLEQFSSCLELSVSASPDPLAKAFKQVASCIHLTSPAIDAKAWKLMMTDRGEKSKYLEVRVEGLLDNQMVTDLLLKKMVVKVVNMASGEVLEEATFQTQISRNLVRRCKVEPGQPPRFEVRLRRPGLGVVANLEVSLLGRAIQDSPQPLISGNQDITLSEPTYGPDNTFMGPSIGELEASKLQDKTQWESSRQSEAVPEASEAGSKELGHGNLAGESLDQSDINSLDLSGRGHAKLSLGLGGNYDSPESRSFARVSRVPQLTDVSEKSDDVRPVSSPACHSQPNLPGKRLDDGNISTFSPRSQGGTTSTVSNGSVLRNALADLEDEDGELPLGQATPLQQEDPLEAEAEPLEKGVVGVEAEPLEELGKVGSQLGPSSPAGNSTLGGQSKLVIDEVQQSLSSEDRTLEDSLREASGIEGNKSNIINITNRSVNFSHRTEIQVLATPTPQLKPGSSRFRTEEGATKVNDGKTNGVQVKHLVDSQALEASLPPYEEMMAENNHTPGTSIACASPKEQKECDKLTKLLFHDLHIGQLGSQGEEQVSSAVEDVGEEDDPHIMLNASKAPTPGQEWTSPTPSEWELFGREEPNVSILPMELLSEELSLTEKSCWETSSLESLAKSCLDFTFTTGLQHVLTVKPPMTNPCDIAYIPKRNIFLVTDSNADGRVGTFSGDNLAFKGWCLYPKKRGEFKERTFSYKYPTNILCTKSGYVFILEKGRILILDEDLKVYHQPPIYGQFSGLTEEEDGSVSTLQVVNGVLLLHRIEWLDSPEQLRLYGKAQYWWDKKHPYLTIKMPKEFSRAHTVSKCWYLTAAGSELHITDFGLGKVYRVNRDGNAQTAFGYLGTREGQLSRPAGILLDDRGNVLVSDSKNQRLQVFSAAGDFVKVVASLPSKPFGLVRQDCGDAGQYVVVACVPCRNTKQRPALVKYRVMPA